VFVGGIVVDDQVELFVGGRLAIDKTQELQPFLMAMTLHASGHHTAVEGVESGKQRGGSMRL